MAGLTHLLFVAALVVRLSQAAPALAADGRPARGIEWQVEPSFKYGLFNFMWSITSAGRRHQYYPEEMARWRKALGTDVCAKLDRLTDSRRSGLSQSGMGAAFTFIEAESTADVLAALDRPRFIEDSVAHLPQHDSARSSARNLRSARADMRDVVSRLQETGYDAYWQREVRPIVEKRCGELRAALGPYSPARVIDEVSKLLDMEVELPAGKLSIWLTYFSYSLCFKLPDNSAVVSFKEGKPIDVAERVSTVTHELLHNFDMGPALWQWHRRLMAEDEFYASRLRDVQRTWGQSDEESFVFAAEMYLAQKMGLRTPQDAQKRMLRQYGGALVLTPVIYDAMLRSPQRLAGAGFHDFVLAIFEDGVIEPGRVEQAYRKVASEWVGARRVEAMFAQQEIGRAKSAAKSTALAFRRTATSEGLVANFERLDETLAPQGFASQHGPAPTRFPVGTKEFDIPQGATLLTKTYLAPESRGVVEVHLLEFDSAEATKKFWAMSIGTVDPRAGESGPYVVGIRGAKRQYTSCACWVQGKYMACVYAPRPRGFVHLVEANRAIEQVVRALCRTD